MSATENRRPCLLADPTKRIIEIESPPSSKKLSSTPIVSASSRRTFAHKFCSRCSMTVCGDWDTCRTMMSVAIMGIISAKTPKCTTVSTGTLSTQVHLVWPCFASRLPLPPPRMAGPHTCRLDGKGWAMKLYLHCGVLNRQ